MIFDGKSGLILLAMLLKSVNVELGALDIKVKKRKSGRPRDLKQGPRVVIYHV